MIFKVGTRVPSRPCFSRDGVRPPSLLVIFCLLFAAIPFLRAESTASAGSSNLLGEAVLALQGNYLNFKTLAYTNGERLNDLVAQSHGTISLRPAETSAASEPIVTSFLPGNVVYWRLASFTPEKDWADLGAQLDQWSKQNAQGIVLDLRSNIAPDDYAGATQIADFFVPDGTTLFIAKDASGQTNAFTHVADNLPRFNQPMIIVVDHQTCGAAEALAACLKARGALLIGQPTAGQAALFQEQKLSSGQVLRYVASDILLPDGTDLWGHPINPDIGLKPNEQNEKNALALIEQNKILDVIQETEARRRLSEAALVQGINPELDAYLASREKKPDVSTAKPVSQDVALISALDSLKAIQLSQRWSTSASGTSSPVETSSSVQ